MPEFVGDHAGLCRTLLTQMSEFAGLWTYKRAPGPALIWLDQTDAGTPPSPLKRFGYWSVETRAFDERDVDGTEQPTGGCYAGLTKPRYQGPRTVTALPPATAPTQAERKYHRFGGRAPARQPGIAGSSVLSGTKGAPEGRQQFPPVAGEAGGQAQPAPSDLGIAAQYLESHLQNGPRR
jgi:hypothetical protein